MKKWESLWEFQQTFRFRNVQNFLFRIGNLMRVVVSSIENVSFDSSISPILMSSTIRIEQAWEILLVITYVFLKIWCLVQSPLHFVVFDFSWKKNSSWNSDSVCVSYVRLKNPCFCSELHHFWILLTQP